MVVVVAGIYPGSVGRHFVVLGYYETNPFLRVYYEEKTKVLDLVSNFTLKRCCHLSFDLKLCKERRSVKCIYYYYYHLSRLRPLNEVVKLQKLMGL